MELGKRRTVLELGIRRTVLVMAIGGLLLALTSTHAHAQFMSHNFRGDFGVLAGTQPPPGWWAAAGYVLGKAVLTCSSDRGLGFEWLFRLQL